MLTRKPKVFIGSSRERMNLAKAVQSVLANSKSVLTVPWWAGVFKENQYNLPSLLDNAIKRCDFAIFIFHPDDISEVRGTKEFSIRDNVVMELGMFYGRFGMERTFFVTPSDGVKYKTPSDLYGINPYTYEWDSAFDQEGLDQSDLESAVSSACEKILEHIRKLGKYEDPNLRLSDALEDLQSQKRLCRFQNESLKAIKWVDIDFDWLLSALKDQFHKKCDIINSEIRITGAALFQKISDTHFKRIGKTGHGLVDEEEIKLNQRGHNISKCLEEFEMLIGSDPGETLIDEYQYQLIVPIESKNGIVNIIYFRVNDPIHDDQIDSFMNEIAHNNDMIFAALKVIFGRRVSDGKTAQLK